MSPAPDTEWRQAAREDHASANGMKLSFITCENKPSTNHNNTLINQRELICQEADFTYTGPTTMSSSMRRKAAMAGTKTAAA